MMSRVKANGWQTDWRCLCTKLVLILRFPFLNRDTQSTFTHALSHPPFSLVVSTCWFKTARLFPPIRSWCGCNTMLFNIYPPLFSLFKKSKNIQLSFSTCSNDTKRLWHLTWQLATHRNPFYNYAEIVGKDLKGYMGELLSAVIHPFAR